MCTEAIPTIPMGILVYAFPLLSAFFQKISEWVFSLNPRQPTHAPIWHTPPNKGGRHFPHCGVTIYPRLQTSATLCTCIYSCPARCSPTLTSIAAAYPPTKIQKEGLKSPPKLSYKLSIYHTPIYYTCNPLHRPSCPCQRGERTRPQRYTPLYIV